MKVLDSSDIYKKCPDKKWRNKIVTSKYFYIIIVNYKFCIVTILLTIAILQKSEKVIFKSPPAFLKNGHFKNVQFSKSQNTFYKDFYGF